MQNTFPQNQSETPEVERLSTEQIDNMDNDALKRIIQSVRREKEDIANGMSHKDHGSHSNNAED